MQVKKDSLVVGWLPLIEAFQSGTAIDKIMMQRSASGEHIGDIRRLAKQHNVPVVLVPNEKISSLTRANHQGVVGFVALVTYLDLQEVIDFVVNKGEAPLFIILDGITDVRNIGAIARTAHCCNAQAIIIPDRGVGQLNEEAMKSSAGALAHMNIVRVSSLMKAVDTLHMNGIKVFASEMTAKNKVYDLDFKEPCAIVMGGEENGVYPALMKICDDQFSIPMPGEFESLNVSVATGMILYEAVKQRIN